MIGGPTIAYSGSRKWFQLSSVELNCSSPNQKGGDPKKSLLAGCSALSHVLGNNKRDIADLLCWDEFGWVVNGKRLTALAVPLLVRLPKTKAGVF